MLQIGDLSVLENTTILYISLKNEICLSTHTITRLLVTFAYRIISPFPKTKN